MYFFLKVKQNSKFLSRTCFILKKEEITQKDFVECPRIIVNPWYIWIGV